MEQRTSRVAWAGLSNSGGDLDPTIQQKITRLLNDFGIALEDECGLASINLFVFPIFKEFHLLAILTSESVLCVVSPSTSGISTKRWLDWRNNPNLPTVQDLVGQVQLQMGWTAISTVSFPQKLLDLETAARLPELKSVAKLWVQQIVAQAEKQARIVRLNPIFRGRDFLIEKDLCFVLMPFREPFFRLYEDTIRPTLETMGLRVTKSNDLFTPTVIVEDIWEYINRAKFLLADVTGKNPNVFYELGIAHTVGKDAIILTQSEDDIPFDLRHLRHITYVDNREGWQSLRRNLEMTIKAILGR